MATLTSRARLVVERGERSATGTKAWVQLALNVLLLICVPVGLCVAKVSKVVATQRGLRERSTAAAVEFLRAHPESGAIYNDYGWGGYLIWKLYPQRKVYIDGRADVYGDAFMEETRGRRRAAQLARAAERYGVRTVFIKPKRADSRACSARRELAERL